MQIGSDEAPDRRTRVRYKINAGMRCKLLRTRQVLSGKLRDISSGGLSFQVDAILQIGTVVELYIDWPARLNDGCPLQLTLRGRVVRSDKELTAIRIQRHEFRTRANPGNAALCLRAPM